MTVLLTRAASRVIMFDEYARRRKNSWRMAISFKCPTYKFEKLCCYTRIITTTFLGFLPLPHLPYTHTHTHTLFCCWNGRKGDKSPFRGARPKLISHISWYPRVFSGGFTEPNSIPARAGVAVPAGNRFGSVNPPKNTRGYQEMCGVGFRVRGIRI